MKKGICVLGSLNIDLTVRLERFHVPGETVTGKSFNTFTGGKGGNQAVAAARLGTNPVMISALGNDANGELYRSVLKIEGVDISCIETVPTSSGVALIEVDDSGENRIAIVAGANACVTEATADKYRDAIKNAGFLLMQLETPLEGVIRAAQLAKESGTVVILDPAPARKLPDELLALCDYITPNETELATLTGKNTDSAEEAEAACRELLEKGVKNVINKRGAKGAMLVNSDGVKVVPGFKVKAVDTTAAGDTFNAAFAAALRKELKPEDAIRFANAAAAISTTAAGAQPAMPTEEQTEQLLKGE